MLTKIQQLQKIVREYKKAGKAWPAQSIDIAKWAIENRRYDLTRPSLERHCARELSIAMAQEHHIDDKGRHVRTMHPARISTEDGQLTLWDDIRFADRPHMESAFYLRRQRVAYQCKQMKTDVDSYNDSHPEEPPFQMPLNFTNDVLEKELADQENTPNDSPRPKKRVALKTA